jgi:CBS domain-containing protein
MAQDNNQVNTSKAKIEKVRDVMTGDVDMVVPSAKISDAAEKMRNLNVGSLPVLDQNKLVGIITDRDITIRATADGSNPDEVMVKEIMTTEVVTVTPEMTLDEASQLMAAHQVRRLPVVENDQVIGMVSLGDLATEPNERTQAGAALTNISFPSEPDTSTNLDPQL